MPAADYDKEDGDHDGDYANNNSYPYGNTSLCNTTHSSSFLNSSPQKQAKQWLGISKITYNAVHRGTLHHSSAPHAFCKVKDFHSKYVRYDLEYSYLTVP